MRVLLVLPIVFAGAAPLTVEFIPWAEGRKVVETIAPAALPSDLLQLSPAERAAAWDGWVRAQDAAIRARLDRGTEDSIAHSLLFGTSFTKEPRVRAEDLRATGANEPRQRLLAARTRDLVAALGKPGALERAMFIRGYLKAKGIEPSAREPVTSWLDGNLRRVLTENDSHARALAAAGALGDRSAEFAERSRLFRTRGLSSDTSLLPNFAIEESLRALKDAGSMGPGSIRRIGIVGPGLDFTDKQDGYDFYPQQSLQPFALADSLVRLGLSRSDDLEIMTFDLNPQVNDHLARAAATAGQGRGYVIQLPLDGAVHWTPAFVGYWKRFGDAIGKGEKPIPVPAGAGAARTRAVRVRPDLVSRVRPLDVNIVIQRPALAPAERLDLVIGTNVFVYYDVFEQSLALANAAQILRPGGFLLSNNALLELPGAPLRSVGYRTTQYSDRDADGDHIVWYRRLID